MRVTQTPCRHGHALHSPLQMPDRRLQAQPFMHFTDRSVAGAGAGGGRPYTTGVTGCGNVVLPEYAFERMTLSLGEAAVGQRHSAFGLLDKVGLREPVNAEDFGLNRPGDGNHWRQVPPVHARLSSPSRAMAATFRRTKKCRHDTSSPFVDRSAAPAPQGVADSANLTARSVRRQASVRISAHDGD